MAAGKATKGKTAMKVHKGHKKNVDVYKEHKEHKKKGFIVLKAKRTLDDQKDFNRILEMMEKPGSHKFKFDGIINSANEKLIEKGSSGLAKWIGEGVHTDMVTSSLHLVNTKDCSRGNAVAETASTKKKVRKQLIKVPVPGKKHKRTKQVTTTVPSRKITIVHAICMRKEKGGGVVDPDRAGEFVRKSFCEAIKKAVKLGLKRVFVKTMGSRHGYSSKFQGKESDPALQKLRNQYFTEKMWEGFEQSECAKKIKCYVFQAAKLPKK